MSHFNFFFKLFNLFLTKELHLNHVSDFLTTPDLV